MTTCFLCTGHVPSDENCPACFGPPPLMAGYNDINMQDDFCLTSPFPALKALDPVTTSTEAIPIHNMELPQSSALRSSDLSRAKSPSRCPQTPRYLFRSRTPVENDIHPKIKDKSDRSNTLSRGTKRSLPNLDNKVIKKARSTVQKPQRNPVKISQRATSSSLTRSMFAMCGAGLWTCRYCGDSPKPKPLLPQLCEKVYPNLTDMLCSSRNPPRFSLV